VKFFTLLSSFLKGEAYERQGVTGAISQFLNSLEVGQMKSSIVLAGVAVWLLGSAFLWGVDAPPAAVKAEAKPAYTLSGPYTHENLTIFLVHGPDQLKDKVFLTLQEAVAQKKAIVHETQNVNELSIENASAAEEIFIQAGDIVKGGRQDRIIAVDLIIPARSGQTSVKMPIASFCCEAGRWQKRGGEATEAFGAADKQAATKDLKIAVRKERGQRAVWDNVARAQMKLGDNLKKNVQSPVSGTSLQLTLEDKDLEKTVDTYVNKLLSATQGKKDVIGYVFAVNGKINSGDMYACNALFQKVWPLLLRGSAVEAFAELKKDNKFDPITADAVKKFLAEVETGKTTEQDLTKRVKMVQQETKQGIIFETRDKDKKDVMVRRSYIAY
jgi:hypothetical protein